MMDTQERYGIGRIPADVDPTSEALAEAAAAEIAAGARTAAYVPHCIERDCGRAVPPRIAASATPGCMVLCAEHWLDYHARMLRRDRPGLTVDAVLDAYAVRDRAEKARPKRCAVCASPDAVWNSGAGRDLCARHWDRY